MTKEINSCNCTFLVRDTSLKVGGACAFAQWLRDEGYSSWGNKGWYYNTDWIFINISTKVYAPGIPGASIAGVIGNHAITIAEFKSIHNIFKKYAGLDLMRMSKKEQNEWSLNQKKYKEQSEIYWKNITYENYIDEVAGILKTKYSVPSDNILEYLKKEEKILKDNFVKQIMPESTAYLLDLMW